MAVSLESLRIEQLRAGALHASHWPGRWSGATLCAGLGLWMTGILILGGSLTGPAVGLLILGLGAMILGPMMLVQGAWLTVDRSRGWIHWHRRWGRRLSRESFSITRLDGIEVRREPGLLRRGWLVCLRIDHPRLRGVVLGHCWRRSTAERLAARLRASLISPDDETLTPWSGSLDGHSEVPPPEILLDPRHPSRLRLPNMIGLAGGRASWLIYAVLWCLWSWTSLAIQWRRLGPLAGWTGADTATIVLLGLAALTGLGLLHAALVRVMGMQVLQRVEGGWVFARRWCGWNWNPQFFQIGPLDWVRRVDHPADQTGLWIPERGCELHVGCGLGPDTLVWLQQTICHSPTAADQHPSSTMHQWRIA